MKVELLQCFTKITKEAISFKGKQIKVLNFYSNSLNILQDTTNIFMQEQTKRM